MAGSEPPRTAEILKNYDQKTALFLDFKNNCHRLIAELLRLETISVHSVTARVKERQKLEEKLEREGKNYDVLDDVTDVVGVRIITHFEDEVDKVGSLIEKEFVIDEAKSADKRKLLDPDRFGYLSLHYICSLSSDRLKLAENRRFKDLVFEIQIRSILQLLEQSKKHQGEVIFQAKRIKSRGYERLVRGVSALHLIWVLVGLAGGEEALVKTINDLAVREQSRTPEQFASEVLSFIRQYQESVSKKVQEH